MAVEAVAAAAAQTLQLLADQIAADFSRCTASAQSAAAFKRILPGLEFLSVAVSSPALAGCIVASANCATEGPTILHLLDPLASAAGLALSRKQPLQLSLLDGDCTSAIQSWTDVQQMVAHAPAVTHLLCLPFGDGAAEASAPACGVHGAAGSGTGALLFGLSQPPQLDARRSMLLAALANRLPAPMQRLSGSTIAFVSSMCGAAAQGCCCCSASDSEDEESEDEAEPAGSPCSDRTQRPPGGDGGGPAHALSVPTQPAQPGQTDAGTSSSSDGVKVGWWKDWGGGRGRAGGKAASHAAASQLDASFGDSDIPFSKALLFAAREDASATRQHPLTLAFRSPLAEREYTLWMGEHCLKLDVMFSLLLAAAILIVNYTSSFPQREPSPGALWLGGGVLTLLAAAWLRRGTYLAHRERLVALVRLCVVAFISLVALRAHRARPPPDGLPQCVGCWMMTAAESLCVTALGFPMRVRLHVPLQLAALGSALWHVPYTCHECHPSVDNRACVRGSVAMALACGCLLPTLVLRYMEQRSRNTFAHRLRCVAAPWS